MPRFAGVILDGVMDKKRILIVEDEAVIALYIENSLVSLGYTVCGHASTADEAVAMAGELLPDIILMDIVLQGSTDGIDAATIIRQKLDIPVIYMTGNADMSTVQRARDSAPYGYVLKPIDILHLFSTIDAVIHRRDLELRLTESEEKYRNLVEEIHDIIYSLDENGTVTFISPRVTWETGLNPEDVVGRPFIEMVHPDDRQYVLDLFSKRREGSAESFEFRMNAKSGQPVWVLTSSMPLVRDGVFRGVRGVISNISVRKKAEEELKMLGAAVDQTIDGLSVSDLEGNILYANRAWISMHGLADADMPGCRMSLFHTGEQMEHEVAPFLEEVRLHGSHEGEVGHVRRDGTVFPTWMSATQLRDERGVPTSHVGVARDITVQKRVERELRESEEKFRAVVDNIRDIVLVMDTEGIIKFENPAVKDILGYQMLGKNGFSIVHPDDIQIVIKDFSDAVTGTNPGIPTEFRVRSGDGSWQYVDALATNLLDHSAISGVLVVLRDIDQRVRTQKALRESEERFRALVQNFQDMILVASSEGVVMYENPAIEATLGYSVVGKSVFEFIHPDDLKVVFKDFGEVLTKTNPGIPTEFRARRLDGSWIYMDALATNLVDNSIIRGILLVLRDIDQRVRTQKALRESEERYRALFDQSPVGVFMFNADLVITECNERLAEIMRSPRELLVGLDLKALKQVNVVPPLLDTLKGNVNHYEGPYAATLSGIGLWIAVSASPLRDETGAAFGGVAVVQDITDRKKAEEDLRLSEERNRLLIENASEGIAVISDWHFVFANRQLAQLSGFSAEELGTKRFTEFIHPDDREMISGRYRKRLEGDTTPFIYEVRFITREGTIRWTELNSVLFLWQGGSAVLLFIRDITERKNAEEERRRIDAQIQVTQKLESLGVLAGGIAHDFNNLLMAILGNIDLALMDMTPSSPARSNLLEAAKASQRAADLCRQMLAYSGRGRFTSEAIDLNEAVDEMGHMLEVSISKKALLRYNFASNLPAIDADATQIRQIIMNLVINASDAIGEKSGIISISTGAIQCDRDYLSETWLNERLPAGLYVYVEVADTGCGMDAQTLPRIFDPFFTTKFTGRGLGLAAVLGIVRSHKGAIKVYSEMGRGTTFKVLFPALERPADRADGLTGSSAEWHGSGTVLLADDEETIRTLGSRMLERLGFSVITAENGSDAVEIFKKSPDKITCVILDLTMPRMDGEETFREMRRIRKDVRIIMSSGYNEQEITQRFAGKGIAGFIQKPYQMADLAARLKTILK